MKYFIGLGSLMWVDSEGNERFTPLSHDHELNISYFDRKQLDDGEWADLDLVGDELTPEGITLNEHWNNIKEIGEKK